MGAGAGKRDIRPLPFQGPNAVSQVGQKEVYVTKCEDNQICRQSEGQSRNHDDESARRFICEGARSE